MKIEFLHGYSIQDVMPLRGKLLALEHVARARITTPRQTYLTLEPAEGVSVVELYDLMQELLRPPQLIRVSYHIGTCERRNNTTTQVVAAGVVFETAPSADIEAVTAQALNVLNKHVGSATVTARGKRYVVFRVEINLDKKTVHDMNIIDALRYARLEVCERRKYPEMSLQVFIKMLQKFA